MCDLIERTHPYIIANKKPNTINQYTQAYNALKTILKNFNYEQVRAKDIAAIKQHYSDRPNMGNRIISYLRMVFDYAVEWQLIDTNPCIGIKRHEEAKRTRYLSNAEFNAIYQQASENLQPIMRIAYLTGQRIGDILKIQLTDITPAGIQFRQEKTGNRLIISMTPELQTTIDQALKLPRAQRGKTLFCTIRGGRPYAYRTVRDMFATAAERAGIEDARLHDIRAKSITDADAQGIDATNLAGHSDPRQTQRYIRLRKTTVATPPKLKT